MTLGKLMRKRSKLVIGLMSGTSADGVDAVLVRIDGWGGESRMEQLAYVSIPFEDEVRRRILNIARGDFGGSQELGRMNMLLGELYLEACAQLCRQAGMDFSGIDLIGSHGQTVYHQPEKEAYLGRELAATYQTGTYPYSARRLACRWCRTSGSGTWLRADKGRRWSPIRNICFTGRRGRTLPFKTSAAWGTLPFCPGTDRWRS